MLLTFLLLGYILVRVNVSADFTFLCLPDARDESHLVQTCRVSQVRAPPGQANDLLTILLVLDSAKLERGSEDLHNLAVLLWILL